MALTEAQDRRLHESFVRETDGAFGFLADLGYRRFMEYPLRIEFRSPSAYLQVLLNPQPGHELYTVDVRLGPLAYDDDRFAFDGDRFVLGSDLVDLLRMREPSASQDQMLQHSRLSFPANHEVDYEQQLRRSIDRVATILRSEFMPALRNDDQVLERLWAKNKQDQERGLAELELRQARPKAREAFQRGDWRNVIDLYEPLRPHLKRHELMRIDYARRKLASGA